MKNLYTLVLCVFFFSLQAQNYYYNGSEKVKIYKSDDSFISFETPNQTVMRGFEDVKTFSTKRFTILENKRANFSTKEFDKQNLKQVTPALLLNNEGDFKMFPTKTIRVKLKSNTNKSKAHIISILSRRDILKLEDKYGILRIKINDIHKALEIANKIYESGLVEFSIPDFYIPMVLNQVDDPLFPQQFQMHNTGQTIDGFKGVNDIDCNAFEAWNITLGNNVTVAVLDDGLENHEDFGNRLIGGFTPATNGNGTPITNDATHGMSSAGIIGASDNNLGIRGVSPNVNLLSVNIFANVATPGDIADGIQWAINNGADVISNSWSYPFAPCGFSIIEIDNAIQNAVTNGRNGKGAIVVFGAGNQGDCVEYPASNANVISVGAIDNRGNLFSYSARGPELDLVAPSGLRFNDVGVRTLDRMGAGNNNGNYRNDFDGTSAACPVVSGVAALVLSVNPNLTQQEVRNILTSTATDMGNGGFDNNFGFGRVNAIKAVRMAQQFSQAELENIDMVCYNDFKTVHLNGNQNKPVTWRVSSNVTLLSSNNNSVTIRAKYSNSTGNGWVKATLSNGSVLQDDFKVGVPSGVLVSGDGLDTRAWTYYYAYFKSPPIRSIIRYEWSIPGVAIRGYRDRRIINISPYNGAGKEINVRVRAYNICGCSSWASTIERVHGSVTRRPFHQRRYRYKRFE